MNLQKTMHNASFHPGGSAARGLFVLHNSESNVGYMDGPVESIKHRRMFQMQDRTNNLDRLFFDPYYR